MAFENNGFLEQFTRACSTESSSNNGSLASSRPNTLTPTVRLDHPTNQSPTEIGDSQLTRLLNGPHPGYSTIGGSVFANGQTVPVGVPLPANGRTVGPEESEQQMGVERLTNACYAFLNKYKTAVMDFRSSCYIYPLHFLITYIPLASIIVGCIYNRECPQISFLPVFVMAVGVVGFLVMCFGIALSCREFHLTPCSSLQKYAVGVLFVLLLILVIVEMYFVGKLSPNFDAASEDYCNKTFYYYVIGKEVATALALITSALIYFPGSSLHNFCLNIPAPLPAGAFFSSL